MTVNYYSIVTTNKSPSSNNDERLFLLQHLLR